MENKELDNFIDFCRALDPKPKLETNGQEMSQESFDYILAGIKSSLEANKFGSIFVTQKSQVKSDIQAFEIFSLQAKEENRPVVITTQKNRRPTETISISDIKDFWSTDFNAVVGFKSSDKDPKMMVNKNACYLLDEE